jgi:hypothetical protein
VYLELHIVALDEVALITGDFKVTQRPSCVWRAWRWPSLLIVVIVRIPPARDQSAACVPRRSAHV